MSVGVECIEADGRIAIAHPLRERRGVAADWSGWSKAQIGKKGLIDLSELMYSSNEQQRQGRINQTQNKETR